MTAQQTVHTERSKALVKSMTRAERERIREYLRLGTYKAAAEKLECDPNTIARTFNRFRGSLADALFDTD